MNAVSVIPAAFVGFEGPIAAREEMIEAQRLLVERGCRWTAAILHDANYLDAVGLIDNRLCAHGRAGPPGSSQTTFHKFAFRPRVHATPRERGHHSAVDHAQRLHTSAKE